MLRYTDVFGNEIDKVQIAIDRIRQFEPEEGYYVAFSGGKDSVVVKDLVKRSGVKADYHYSLTTVDPPELVYFIREHHADAEVHKPKESMWQLIEKKGIMPTRTFRFCCGELKEGGGNDRVVVTGVRWAESVRRSKRRLVEQCARQKGKHFLHPIIDWSDDEVWSYIHEQGLPYCKLYDEGHKRIGCIMCPMTGSDGMLRDAKRWPTYFAMYKQSCAKAIETRIKNGLRCGEDFKTVDRMMHWWIYSPEKQDPDQTVMFE